MVGDVFYILNFLSLCANGRVDVSLMLSLFLSIVRRGGRGGYGGGGRRDNYRDSGGSGPDRQSHGGNRSRPY